ncbi:hypothetical protein MKX03_031163, partial [Papaver bracteatum]
MDAASSSLCVKHFEKDNNPSISDDDIKREKEREREKRKREWEIEKKERLRKLK